MNAKLNMNKLNDSKIANQNNKTERSKKEETSKNEITCIYNIKVMKKVILKLNLYLKNY